MVILIFSYEVFAAFKDKELIEESLLIVDYNPNWYLFSSNHNGLVK